jgi:hypothetical protein
MAPEVMEGSVYTEKVDTYSFGVLLSELATRQMPFHDKHVITCYMDVVDAVLDNGATPTIPKWCESLLGGLIQQCVSRVPEDRPSFTELIMKLREVADLEDSHYFFQFDLPRLRELMMSPLPAIQSLAASEVAVLLTNPLIRRRSSPEELAELEDPDQAATPEFGASPALSAASPGASPTPLTLTPAVIVSPPSARQATELNLGGLTSPLETGPAFASNNMQNCGAAVTTRPASHSLGDGSGRAVGVEGSEWLLDNEDSCAFIDRFTALLSSSHREVQLHSCHALRSLLRLSEHDRIKRAQDRELVITNGGLASLLTLLVSEQQSLSSSAGEVLLLLTGDLSSEELKNFTGLNSQALTQLQNLMLADMDRDVRAIQQLQRKMVHKKRVLEVVQTCATRGAMDASASPVLLSKPRAPGRRSFNGVKFQALIAETSLGSSAIAARASAQEDSSDEDESRPDHVRAISQQLMDATLDGGVISPGTAVGSLTSPPPASVLSGPSTPALQVLLDQLLAIQKSPPEVPENFSEWYSGMRYHAHALRYDVEGDTWRLCILILLADEIRLFHSWKDEPDEPVFILRTRLPPARDAVDDTPQPCKVRVGHKHGLPHCFQLEDCGSMFTFCAGTQDEQEQWRTSILGIPKQSAVMPETPVSPNSAAAAAQTPCADSIAPPPPPLESAQNLNMTPGRHPRAASGSVTALAAAAAAHAYNALALPLPALPAEPDPTIGRELPHLELPTPPFSKRYRNISYHGYLMLRDRISNAWTSKYLLLCGCTLRVFDSHRSSPHEPWAEHDIDPEITLAISKGAPILERRITPGANQFFIRLYSSSVLFDVWADSAAEKQKWLQAIGGDALAAAVQAHGAAGSSSISSSSSHLTTSPASVHHGGVSAARIAAFAAYYGHIDYYG